MAKSKAQTHLQMENNCHIPDLVLQRQEYQKITMAKYNKGGMYNYRVTPKLYYQKME